MNKHDKPSRVNFTVAPGSALARLLQHKTHKTASAAIHEMAAQFEAVRKRDA